MKATKQEMADYGSYAEGESPLRERIGVYWNAVGGDFDGSNHDAYWSAVFVSYRVREAGGASTFRCSEQHSTPGNRRSSRAASRPVLGLPHERNPDHPRRHSSDGSRRCPAHRL